jgi:hypothetical protein
LAKAGAAIFDSHENRWLWVPAFAGTTIIDTAAYSVFDTVRTLPRQKHREWLIGGAAEVLAIGGVIGVIR